MRGFRALHGVALVDATNATGLVQTPSKARVCHSHHFGFAPMKACHSGSVMSDLTLLHFQHASTVYIPPFDLGWT
jgi:hypothetical protein